MFDPTNAFNRRRFLRGLGTSLALPLLPSALPRQVWAAAEAAVAKPPVRLAFLFIPNGVNMEHWRPKSEGQDFEFSRTLKPLEKYRQRVQVLSGLAHDTGWSHGDGPGDHARNASTFLTGMHPYKTDGAGIRVGVSVDQLAAQHFAKATKFPSLELGVERGRNAGGCDSGYSCAYSHNISWRTKSTPSTKEINPRLLFDRMFGSGSEKAQAASRSHRDAEQRSLLDLVQGDAKSLSKQLSGADRVKLDEYLDGVRTIEQRIEHEANSGDDADQLLSADGKLQRPKGIPKDYARHLRLMADLLVLAFQTDQTRVSSLMLGAAGSQLTYSAIGIRQGHHTLSHHKNDPETLEHLAAINRYHVEQLAYFLDRLDAIPEGDGTLLDHSLISYGSGLSDGNRHNHNDLPILLAGGGGGAIHGGAHRMYEENTPLMNLYLKMLQTAGVPVEEAGDSTGPLDVG